MPDGAERRTVRLLLVDDHAVVRLGLRALLEAVPHFEVVGEAGAATTAVGLACRLQPDVVVMDVRLPDGSGVEACREIRATTPGTRVLMLTSYVDEDTVVASLQGGASGYLLKDTPPDRLVAAVELIAQGGSILDPGATRSFAGRFGPASPAASDPLAALSEPQRRVLELMAEGRTNREIAAVLHLSRHTVKAYVSEVLHKLNLRRRVDAAALVGRNRRLVAP